MLKILGGSGFIGTRLCERLKKANAEFAVIDKAMSKSFADVCQIADVRDIKALEDVLEAGDTIMNLAAEHRDDVRPKSLYDEVNVGGASNVCDVAEEKGINKIIFTSSVAVYGFAPPGTDESGEINYFNDYGRTKWEAEKIYKKWQAKDPENRTLVIVRPTVVFGEQNRGNVYNLLRQIASGKFMMVGNGKNVKSMAYVENVAAFLEYSIDAFNPGVHIFNYIDKPDFDMNTLVGTVNSKLGKSSGIKIRLPYTLGLAAGYGFDLLARITGKNFTVSSIRIKKFCATTQFDTSISKKTDFTPPVSLQEGLERTIKYEFLEDNTKDELFYTE
jgi:nucleoside-diphosphate-sugar epimerase